MILKAMQSVAGGVRAGYIRIVPERWRGHDWSARPMIPGKWRKVAPDIAMTLMIRLCTQDERVAAICAAHDIVALRKRALTSIKDALLIEFQAVPHDGGARAIGAFIYRPGLFDLIDGRAIVLHRIADEGAIELETAKQALEFCQLFCAATQGEDGCFFPARRGHPNVMNAKHPRFWESLKQLAMPPEIEPGLEEWRIEMPIAYGPGFYRSRFTLDKSANNCVGIEMLGDEHLCGIIPASPQGWEDGLRFNYGKSPDGLSDPCSVCAEQEEEGRRDAE